VALFHDNNIIINEKFVSRYHYGTDLTNEKLQWKKKERKKTGVRLERGGRS
jgi:hypothetical protein